MDCMSKNWKYDVFVSFRGETRFNFTDHLFAALHRHAILAFRDDTKLDKGEVISEGLMQAIEGSQVLIVVFSMNYASSTWCLQELANIADCIQETGQHVLPVFYDVSPSEVRKQSGNYEVAFMEHEERFKDDGEMMEQMQRWRRALTQVANLSGWDLRDKSQSVEIEKIVKVVTRILTPKLSSSPYNDIVGMQSPLEELEKLLVLDSDDDVRVAGICGMGGIGKKAFKSNHVAKDYESLTVSALAYANGLPLAIRVLGSFLYGRDFSEWSSALVRLKEYPSKDVMDVLRISFDGLEDMEKEIFLDIACFFCDNLEEYVKDILRIRGFHPDIGIRTLIDKSLIASKLRWIKMHDLLIELGRNVVREKSPNEPRK
ncbi:hypothetical protein PIB30_101594 [Stylosanthes scabra]|uniref:TIR domain-containing protein n=1 Tax=Stylosanthes scabra TaxID=79078 RepID=A0ABU6YYX8_9FABA|nr:hypothetical protein [Stylosanthes scabra]